MEQHRTYQQPAPDAAADWLPPGAALAQFEPPESMQASAPVRHEERVRYGFRVGAVGLLIPLETGSEVLEMPVIAAIPGTPPGFLGLINLRGNLVPLYELRTLLRMEPRNTRTKLLALVFGQGDTAVAVVVDEFPVALTSLEPLAGLPPLPDVLQDHVREAYAKGDMAWLDFDFGAFFDEVSRGIRLGMV